MGEFRKFSWRYSHHSQICVIRVEKSPTLRKPCAQACRPLLGLVFSLFFLYTETEADIDTCLETNSWFAPASTAVTDLLQAVVLLDHLPAVT
jgi:hypothetical protein